MESFLTRHKNLEMFLDNNIGQSLDGCYRVSRSFQYITVSADLKLWFAIKACLTLFLVEKIKGHF